jgi:hypothetical protein
MTDERKGFSKTKKRIADSAKAHDAVQRAREATNSAIGQAKDRLGTPGFGGQRL